jgi:lipid-binding SYLF domain-containing protein
MADKSGDRSMYGHDVDRHEIVNGTIHAPASARRFEHELDMYAGAV